MKHMEFRESTEDFDRFCQVVKQKDRAVLSKEMWLKSVPWTLVLIYLFFSVFEQVFLTVIVGILAYFLTFSFFAQLLHKEYESFLQNLAFKAINAANEFILVLDSTYSLQDACELIAAGKYGQITKAYQDAIQEANFGDSLELSLLKNLEKSTFGIAQELLIKIIQIWSESPESISIMTDNIFTLAESHLLEQSERINTMASIQGISSALPPVLITFLLISGFFSLQSSIMICIFLIVLQKYNSINQIYDEEWEQSSEALGNWGRSTIIATFSEQLKNCNNYSTALLTVLNQFIIKDLPEKRAIMNEIAYGIPEQSETIKNRIYKKVMDKKTKEYLLMGKRFAEIDTEKAAFHLMRFSNKLQKIEGVVAQKNAKIKVERARLQVLHTFSTVSLSLIATISPILIIVSMITSHPVGSIPSQTFTLQQYLFILLQIIVIQIFSTRSAIDFFPKSQNEKQKSIKMIRFIVLFLVSLIIGEFLFYKSLGRIYLIFG
ncbi:MAG: hypothetical protein ACFFCQ_00305 [Promethearchaeota archaeon]